MSDKIVVADDSATMRKMIRRALMSAGVDDERIVFAVNGQKALQAVEIHSPCLVVSDVNMPEMDGRELLRQLGSRGLLDALPVVMVTSVSATRVLLDLTRLGATQVVRKPFHPTELGAILASYVSAGDQGEESLPAGESESESESKPPCLTEPGGEEEAVATSSEDTRHHESPFGVPVDELLRASNFTAAQAELSEAVVVEPVPPIESYISDALDVAIVRTMADLAFVDAQRASVSPPNRSVMYRARVYLTHPAPGQLELLATRRVAEELAANLVGESAVDDLACLDALGELANVVAGQLRPIEADDVMGFGLPQVGVVGPGDGHENHRAFSLDGDPSTCLFVQLFEAA